MELDGMQPPISGSGCSMKNATDNAIKYASVMFLIDGVTKVVPINRITVDNKHVAKFEPKSCSDYDPKHKYYVKWYYCGNDGDICKNKEPCNHEYDFYSTFITHLGESVEKIDSQLKDKRTHVYNRKYASTTESDNDTTKKSDDVEEFKNRLKSNNDKKKKALHERNNKVLNKLEMLFELPTFVDSNQQESENTENDSENNKNKENSDKNKYSQNQRRLKDLRVTLEPINTAKYIQSTLQSSKNNPSSQQNSLPQTISANNNSCSQSTSQVTQDQSNALLQKNQENDTSYQPFAESPAFSDDSTPHSNQSSPSFLSKLSRKKDNGKVRRTLDFGDDSSDSTRSSSSEFPINSSKTRSKKSTLAVKAIIHREKSSLPIRPAVNKGRIVNAGTSQHNNTNGVGSASINNGADAADQGEPEPRDNMNNYPGADIEEVPENENLQLEVPDNGGNGLNNDGRAAGNLGAPQDNNDNEIQNAEEADGQLGDADEHVPQRLYTKANEFILQCIFYYEKATDGTDAFREKQNRYTENANGEIYLGENISIDKTVYEYLQIEKPSYFISTVAKHLWGGPLQLMNRAMDLTNGANNIPNRSPVKLVEHNLLRLLISLYWDFLKGNKSFTSKERNMQLNKAVDYLRYHIRNLRSAEIKRRIAGNREAARNNNNRKKQRYNYQGPQ